MVSNAMLKRQCPGSRIRVHKESSPRGRFKRREMKVGKVLERKYFAHLKKFNYSDKQKTLEFEVDF